MPQQTHSYKSDLYRKNRTKAENRKQTIPYTIILEAGVHELRTRGIDWVSFNVLSFIIERTVMYNHVGEFISYNQFTNGVYRRNGTCITPGLQHDRTTIGKKLRLLEEKGYISVRKNTGFFYDMNAYTLKYEGFTKRYLKAVPERLKKHEEDTGKATDDSANIDDLPAVGVDAALDSEGDRADNNVQNVLKNRAKRGVGRRKKGGVPEVARGVCRPHPNNHILTTPVEQPQKNPPTLRVGGSGSLPTDEVDEVGLKEPKQNQRQRSLQKKQQRTQTSSPTESPSDEVARADEITASSTEGSTDGAPRRRRRRRASAETVDATVAALTTQAEEKRDKTLQADTACVYNRKALTEFWNALIVKYNKNGPETLAAAASQNDVGRFLQATKTKYPMFKPGATTEWKAYLTDVVDNWSTYVGLMITKTRSWRNPKVIVAYPSLVTLAHNMYLIEQVRTEEQAYQANEEEARRHAPDRTKALAQSLREKDKEIEALRKRAEDAEDARNTYERVANEERLRARSAEYRTQEQERAHRRKEAAERIAKLTPEERIADLPPYKEPEMVFPAEAH